MGKNTSRTLRPATPSCLAGALREGYAYNYAYGDSNGNGNVDTHGDSNTYTDSHAYGDTDYMRYCFCYW